MNEIDWPWTTNVMWEQFLSRVKIIKHGRGPWIGPAPLKVVLEEAGKLKISFPESYLAFATEVGPVVMSRYYRILTPTKEAKWCDLLTEVRRIKKALAQDLIERGREELAHNFVPFSNTVGGDTIGWDTGESSVDGGEYPIYFVDRRSKGIYRIAENFPDYINHVCLGTRLLNFISMTDYRVYYEIELFPLSEDDEAETDQESERLAACFAAHLKQLREESGLSLKELAQKAEVARDDYKDIETANAMPSFAQIENIARALGVPVFHLFKFDEE